MNITKLNPSKQTLPLRKISFGQVVEIEGILYKMTRNHDETMMTLLNLENNFLAAKSLDTIPDAIYTIQELIIVSAS